MRAAVAVAVALSAGCQATDAFRISEFSYHERAVSESITVVSWNAQKGADARFESDLSHLLDVNRPDFVFLQEARADLLTSNLIGGHFASSWSYPWPNGKTIGLLSLSHVPPLDVRPVPSRHREFLVTAPKLSLVTRYPLVNGEQLLAVNVHVLAFERWSTNGMRSQMDDLADIMKEHTGPIILVGDFNTWSEKRLDLVREVAEELNLVEVVGFPPGRTTADKNVSFLNWLLGVDEELPLDRMYYRGFTHHSAKVLPYESSDHRPIQVTFDLESPVPAFSGEYP